MTPWVWLAVALPLGGFLVNGALSLRRPDAKGVVSLVGPGVLVAAFLVSLGVFADLLARPPEHGAIVRLWSWLPVGKLQIDLAFQVDQLSVVMLLVVTGVGSLIHLFSVGYMRRTRATPATSRTSTCSWRSCWCWCWARACR